MASYDHFDGVDICNYVGVLGSPSGALKIFRWATNDTFVICLEDAALQGFAGNSLSMGDTEGIVVINDKKEPIDRIGTLLNKQWMIKKSLTDKISNDNIDEIYQKGIKAGAIGGKLLGAGAGGFILFYVPLENQSAVKEKLSHLLHVPFRFDFTGSQIIYYSHDDNL